MMKSMTRFFLVLVIFAQASIVGADETTAEDVYNLVLNASNMLEELGEEGLTAFNTDGEFSLKDTYVWVVNCDEKRVIAHPNNNYIGLDLTKVKDKHRDESKRRPFVVEMCAEKDNANGVWVEYWWEKLGQSEPARKISFMVQVPNQPYQVTAGIYNDTMTVSELNGTR
ncbi:hypothetical protein DSCA_37650 [Desulfosarcina alkanivorans]|jgi:signal transduction histidine kinase|uniref:Double Cache domain-containing protein n=1 Tax=Desulfosarcina alkanivorans TaxID=571177 RepID=A0A5K7YN82_9BACT|nr:cache domain-containing protein [Desulfosarcina alkanivorans]BBO69835.1 hypothetical protein DSCA_37650 [Desulfosarcina alkanivorans]